MVEINQIDPEQLSRAVVVWTGYESSACPTRNDVALAGVFPTQTASALMSLVKALEEDFYKSEAHITAANLSKMKEEATLEFRRQHPELPSVIADAFAWCYTFDYK